MVVISGRSERIIHPALPASIPTNSGHSNFQSDPVGAYVNEDIDGETVVGTSVGSSLGGLVGEFVVGGAVGGADGDLVGNMVGGNDGMSDGNSVDFFDVLPPGDLAGAIVIGVSEGTAVGVGRRATDDSISITSVGDKDGTVV